MRLLLSEIMESKRNTKDFEGERFALKIGQKEFFMILLKKRKNEKGLGRWREDILQISNCSNNS